ncbi:MAG: MotA/TolQ/ExbB proton channel family protein, partial [Planctomycetes bacterium]|nr:MotA/TolQ/ExbB proton channel family protein [Planctomycetota bacterium]
MTFDHGLTGTILAQAASGGGAVQSIWDFIAKGGMMMIPIGICSLVALAVMVERLISLRRSRVIPPGFMDGVRAALDKGGDDRTEALAYCRKDPSPLAGIVVAAIQRLGARLEHLERHIEQAGQRQLFKMRKYLRVLSVVASISPLLGLLGTIFGMIRAFSTVASSGEALGKTELLAQGIYEAMITTAAGLCVAIPVLIAYHWISANIARLVGEMDLMIIEFVETYAPVAPDGRSAAPAALRLSADKRVVDAQVATDGGDQDDVEAQAEV